MRHVALIIVSVLLAQASLPGADDLPEALRAIAKHLPPEVDPDTVFRKIALDRESGEQLRLAAFRHVASSRGSDGEKEASEDIYRHKTINTEALYDGIMLQTGYEHHSSNYYNIENQQNSEWDTIEANYQKTLAEQEKAK